MKYQVEFYYDVISPYSWIGFEAITRYAKVWPIDLKLKPVLLGGVMADSGNKPPMSVAAKQPYMVDDLDNLSSYWKVPVHHPDDVVEVLMNRGSLLPMRFLTVLRREYPFYLEAASREFWMRVWSRDEPIHRLEDIRQVAIKIGIPNVINVINHLIAMMNTDEIKNELKKMTNEAVDSGAFGAPWTVLTMPDGKKYRFFGSDRIHVLGHIIGQPFKGPLIEHSKL